MNVCEAVSDRMPAVASGRSEWTAEERAHIARCGDCSAEWMLVRSASRLGGYVSADAAALVPQLLERLRQAKWEERRRVLMRRAAQLGSLAVAAVVLLVLVPRWRTELPAPPAASVPVVSGGTGELQLAELDDAAPAELEMVLVEFDEPAVPASSLDGLDLEGLDMSQVERALRSWEEG